MTKKSPIDIGVCVQHCNCGINYKYSSATVVRRVNIIILVILVIVSRQHQITVANISLL